MHLGIPLTIAKPAKADLLPLIDKVANKLPGWKASLLNKAGRLVLVKSVLSSTPVHLMLALDLPKWVLKAIDIRMRGFLWKGQEQANGGNCLVSWRKVQQPYQYGGLGIHDLERMGWALRLRWLWFLKTDTSKPWIGLPIQIPTQAEALFKMAVEVTIGNGEDTLFWTDKWLQGRSVANFTPDLYRAIPKRTAKNRTMSHALFNRSWVSESKVLSRFSKRSPKEGRKGFNSMVILVCWELWKRRNACVLEKIRLDVQIMFQSVVAEGHLWCLARASTLQDLFVRIGS
ncbi:hypothetical protein U9M48_011850 [Paspalum notatum var. saurae]|uniref:Reverse transcriptase zinc-binding domain-containing protein n=1 Tax=Paspalum notatum var. saurae TaxID=547442 RepID=A0AAQ3SWQ2_PASNO